MKMKGILLLLAMLTIAQYGFAEVVKPSEDMLDGDLNFHQQETASKGDGHTVAGNKDQVTEKDGARDVASGKESKPQSSSVKFWDY